MKITTKAILAAGVTLLLLAGSLPVLATQPISLQDQEAGAVQAFFDKIDRAAQDSRSMQEFGAKLKQILNSKDDSRFPVIEALRDRIRTIWNKNPIFYFFGIPIGNGALSKNTGRPTSTHFVISYGAYHRYNPLRHNTITVIKDRLSAWHYRSSTQLFKGRTLIIDRHPFGIGKRLIGPQAGLMRGFHGIYFDHESKLTGNSYLFFIGSVDHIHAISLTPFK